MINITNTIIYKQAKRITITDGLKEQILVLIVRPIILDLWISSDNDEGFERRIKIRDVNYKSGLS